MSLGSEHHLDENLGLAVELWTWKLGGRAKQIQCRQVLIVTDMASYQVISNHLKLQESSGLPPGLSLRVKITLEMSSSLTVLLSKSSMSSMSSRIITLNSPNYSKSKFYGSDAGGSRLALNREGAPGRDIPVAQLHKW